MSTIKIKIENLGVNKNKGQGWNAWIKSTDRAYYSKFCQDEEEGKAAIGSLQPGDTIILKYSVKNGFNNFVSYQSNSLESSTDKKTEKQEAEKKPVEQKKEHPKTDKHDEHREKEVQEMKAIEKKLVKEEQAKEKSYDQYYVIKINKAERIVDHAGIPKEDPAYPSVLAAVFEKITTPWVYLKEKEVAKYLEQYESVNS